MQKLNAHGKLVLGLIVTLTAALPLACGSDDSNGVPNEEGGASGKGGAGGAASGGKGGAGKGGGGAGKGGAAQAGSPAAGGGGPEAGAAEMGGEGGATEPMGGAGGEEEMGGAAGATGVDDYDANVDAACTTEGSLNCSGSGAAADKQTCVDGYTGLPEFVPPCAAEIKAFMACIAPLPASSFECMETQASQKADVCSDEYLAMGNCFAAQN